VRASYICAAQVIDATWCHKKPNDILIVRWSLVPDADVVAVFIVGPNWERDPDHTLQKYSRQSRATGWSELGFNSRIKYMPIR
jgi:hypothetical protein